MCDYDGYTIMVDKGLWCLMMVGNDQSHKSKQDYRNYMRLPRWSWMRVWASGRRSCPASWQPFAQQFQQVSGNSEPLKLSKSLTTFWTPLRLIFQVCFIPVGFYVLCFCWLVLTARCCKIPLSNHLQPPYLAVLGYVLKATSPERITARMRIAYTGAHSTYPCCTLCCDKWLEGKEYIMNHCCREQLLNFNTLG